MTTAPVPTNGLPASGKRMGLPPRQKIIAGRKMAMNSPMASIIRTSGARVIERNCARAMAAASSGTQGSCRSTQLLAAFTGCDWRAGCARAGFARSSAR